MQYIVFLLGIVFVLITVMTFKRKTKDTKKTFVLILLSAAIIALSLEVFTFNYNSYEIIGKNCKQISYYQKIDYDNIQDSNDNITVNKLNMGNDSLYTIDITDIDTVVNNIDIVLEGNAETADCTFLYTDEATSTLRQIDSDPFVIVMGMDSTGHIKPQLAGKAGTFQFKITTHNAQSLSAITIKLNERKKFEFNIIRVIAVFLIVLLALAIYKRPYLDKRIIKGNKTIKSMMIAFLFAEVFFMIILADSGIKDYSVLSKYTTPQDMYQELTVALSKGKVDLNGLVAQNVDEEQESIEKLQKLDNPYEWSQREGINAKWDRAFYNGKYYCYFGIVPVILFYLPCYFITGKLLNTHLLALLFIMAVATAMMALVYNIAKQRNKEINVWIMICAAAGFINCSMILSCIGPSNFYEVAKLSALFFSLLGINLIYTAFQGQKTRKKQLAFGALSMAIAVGCRPNFILASFVVLPIVFKALYLKKGEQLEAKSANKITFVRKIQAVFNKENLEDILCFILPYVIVGVFIMYYNYIRFDSIFEFGAKYQLTVYDTSYYSLTDFGKVPVALYKGLFMMPSFSSKFPFVNPVLEKSNYIGYFYRMAGIGVCAYPLMWLIAMLPWSLKRGIKVLGERGFMVASLLVGLISCYVTTACGGSSLGYSVDFAWLLYIPVIYVIFDLYDFSKKKGIKKYVFSIILFLSIITVVMNMLICFSDLCGNIAKNCPQLFYGLQKMIIFWR